MKVAFLFESLRAYIARAAPNFVVRDDLVRLEGRLDELVELSESLEQAFKAIKAGERRRPPRP
ncbi:MAG: hypothetical protein EOO40_09200 [Deltaproteobacteria bacterium]|nr:MAG: hypothetical protein EOO40_09200 [Deltaproteobacteria bacterium]